MLGGPASWVGVRGGGRHAPTGPHSIWPKGFGILCSLHCLRHGTSEQARRHPAASGGREECELTLAYVADEDHAAGETCPLYRSGLAFGRQFGPGCVVLQAYLAEKVHRSCWPPWHVVMIREA